MNKQELQNEFWNKIYDDYAKVILNIAADILKDEYLAQDVVQEVMYKYYVYLRENDVEFEKSWLIKVTKNVSFNLVKKLKHELDYIDFDQLQIEEDEMINGYSSTEDAYIRQLCQREAEELCNQIFEETKHEYKNAYEALKALYQKKETRKETAHRLHMSENALYTMMSRTKAKLKKQYGSKYTEITKI